MNLRVSAITFSLIAILSTGAVNAIEIVDLNGDGVLTADEVQAARDSARAEQLELFDTDADGELSRVERRVARDARIATAIETFDTDADSVLSDDERDAAREFRQESFAANFDLNNDNELSETEQANLDDIVEEIRGSRTEAGGRGTRSGNAQRSEGRGRR